MSLSVHVYIYNVGPIYQEVERLKGFVYQIDEVNISVLFCVCHWVQRLWGNSMPYTKLSDKNRI